MDVSSDDFPIISEEGFYDVNVLDGESEFEGDEEGDVSDEDDIDYNGTINRDAEWGGIQGEVPRNNPFGVGDFGHLNHLDSDHGGSADEDQDFVDSSDEDDTSKMKFNRFNAKVHMNDVKFTEGMIFSTANEFRGALRDYAIRNGKEIRWIHNDGPKLKAGCAEGCDWTIYVSKMNNENTLQVKSLHDVHKCSRVMHNKLVTSTWIGIKYLKEFRCDPKMSIKTLRVKLQEDWVVYASRSQFYRARKYAREIIEGCDRQQYGRLYDYCHELRKTNPGSTTIIKTVDGGNEEEVFQRVYICLGALKRGMKEGCRPIIGLDGAHLRGTNTGQVLCAVGLDGNNQTYPFAYAIVEIENKDTWKWFLKLIVEDLEIENSHHWTFISDKQKGLIPAIEEDYPGAEHRFCIRHFYSNFMTENKGLLLKKLFYRLAKVTTEPEFNALMFELKCTDAHAFNWLSNATRNPRHWSKAFYKTHCKSDIQTNNNCESLNGSIREAREKPILTLLESIRELLMDRLVERQRLILKYEGRLCPNIQEIIEKLKIDSGKCVAKDCTRGYFQVTVNHGGLFAVNLPEKSCGCRIWELTGIPCSHAISAIFSIRKKPEDYVDDYYLVSTYMKAYGVIINPINGPDLWERTTAKPPLPPFYHKQPGRPKLARNMTAEEREAAKKKGTNGKKMKRCSNCGENTHNSRTCKNPTNLDHQRKHLPRWKDKVAEAKAREEAQNYTASLPKNKGGRPKKRPYGDVLIPPPTATVSSYAPSGFSGTTPETSSDPVSARRQAARRQHTRDPEAPTQAAGNIPTLRRLRKKN